MTQARFPLGHYVDDVLGAARTDIRWTGGYLLDILCSCLGFLADPAKANDFRWVMDVLGVEAQLVWADKLIRLRVSTDKIRKWLEVLARILADRRLTPEEASKMAGRLSFAVTAAGNKVGRAFIKPSTPKCLPPFPIPTVVDFCSVQLSGGWHTFLPVSQRHIVRLLLVHTLSVGQMLREPPGSWRRSSPLRGACGSQDAESLISSGPSYSHELMTR